MASASIQVTEPFLSQVERVREEMRANFLRSHQILQQREAALMSELDQLKANYRVEKIKEQMQDLNRMEESLNSTVQCEENKEIVEASVALMKRRHRELEVGLESLLAKMWGVELNWREELECRLSEIGEIKLIAAPTLKHEKGNLEFRYKCTIKYVFSGSSKKNVPMARMASYFRLTTHFKVVFKC